MGIPNREPQEFSGNIMGIYLPGSLYSYDIPTIFVGFPVLGVTMSPPLFKVQMA